MSYILDALRKSDAQRQLGQPPDLASGPSAHPPTRRSPRRWLGPVLILGMVLIGLVSVWLIQDRFAGPEPEHVATAPEASGIADGTDPPVAEEALAERADAPAPQPAPPVDRRSPDQRPATVVSRPAARRPGDRTLPSGERERLVETAEEAQRLIEEQRAAVAALERTAEALPQAPPPAETARTAPATPAVPVDEAWQPDRAESEFVRVWELPLSVRRDLPRLDLSIHVFSVEAGQRFVLINGERHVEGDALGDGARLVEIRREGALVDFRDYVFLLEP